MQKVGVVRFWGTNCDRDVWQAVVSAGLTPEWLWFADRFNPAEFSAIIIPGGFSYGDYLRAGALAARSAVMLSVAEAAGRGVPVLGICNGFQILCEARLLPGALVQNTSLRFIDKWIELFLTSSNKYWGKSLPINSKIRLPIAHGEGRFFAEPEQLKELQDNNQIWWSYCGDSPNGSLLNIAGVTNKAGNVAGLMPHPERAVFAWMGGTDGLAFF